MCGIAGIVHLDGRPVARADLERMNRAQAHRGPDGEGVFLDGAVGLGHTRLAIIDPAGGEQPLLSDDGRLALVYNGEVYNYRELRDELAGGGTRFRTASDTEVVLRAYERWGTAAVERFRGMFAFALYDGRQGRLVLVRDRLGIKPLYYGRADGRFVFASELAALRGLGLPDAIDPEAVAAYLRYQYVPTPRTIYRHLRKLEPGHVLELDPRTGAITDRAYWRLAVRVRERSEEACLEELNAALDETARLYVRSDVPFGAFLSGGVDSSLVTAVMGPHVGEPVRTFAIGFYEREHSELPWADEVSRTLGTAHTERVVSPEAALEVIRRLVVHFGEPFADSSAVPTYYVSREGASRVKMVLSGDGGDEGFGGYWSYAWSRREAAWAWPALGRAMGRCLARLGPTARLRRGGRFLAMDPEAKHHAQREIFGPDDLRAVLHPDVPAPPRKRLAAGTVDDGVDPVTRFQALDVQTYLLDDILTKVDRMSMANSLEVRVPLLDHEIVELAFSLPPEMKVRRTRRGVRTKHLLKRSAARFFPDRLLDRPKQGFGIPIVAWCRGPLREPIEAGLRARANPLFDWIRFDTVRNLLDAFLAGEDGRVAQVWALWMFDLWMKDVHRGPTGP